MSQHVVAMECSAVKALFSDYLDGAVSGRNMLAIAGHLKECGTCGSEFSELRSMQRALATLKAAKAPADMGLKLRVAISQQKARQESRWRDLFAVRWENAIRPVAIQVSAGFAGTVVLIGAFMLLLGLVASPQPVMAHDVPLGAVTSPHYLYSAANERPIVTGRDTTIVVEADINASGEVYDYRIVSDPQTAEVQQQIAEQLMLSVFEPARIFGVPARGRVIMTFAGISVRG